MLQVAKRPSATLPPPTEEQLHILSLIRCQDNNLLVNALAGTGKTTTLEMIQSASRRQPVLCLAFNRRIADEMERRFTPSTTVRTFNGIGHRVWAKDRGKALLEDKKCYQILNEAIGELKGDDRRTAREAFWDILKAVGLAKALGYIPEGKFPTAKRLLTKEQLHVSLDSKPGPLEDELIHSTLFRSIQGAFEGWIDYNDQIYMPALFGGSFPRFPFVLVDEVQDLNPTNHEMLRRLVSGRLCAVGDPWQSIYGFRGAVQGGMQKLKEDFECEEADLSISFRCPKRIVQAAHWRVPHFQWVKEGGHVEALRSLSLPSIPEDAAILCRNNAPLFRLAFALLKAKRSVQVAGSEIGPRIIRTLQKLGDPRDDSEALVAKIDAWANAKLEITNKPGLILDQAECMKVFATFAPNLAQAVAYAEHLFKQQGSIKLSTVHKAKGLEWDTVYFLDRWLCDDNEQDLNLQYVAQTRAKQTLYEIDSNNIKW